MENDARSVSFPRRFTWIQHLYRPGQVLFAILFTLDSIARAILAPVIPLEALRLLDSARNVSVAVTIAGLSGILAALVLPSLIHLWRPRATYLFSIFLLGLAALLMLTGSLSGFGAGWMLRSMAAACLLGLINIYIASFIDKRRLATSEPVRTFVSAIAWVVCPLLGVKLYTIDAWLPFIVSAGAAGFLFLFFYLLRLQAPMPEVARIGFHPIRNIRRYFSQPRLTLAWLLNFGRETWWVVLFTYATIYLVQAGRPEMEAGILLSICSGMLFLTLGLGWLGRRIGLRRFVACAFLWVALSTLAAALASDDPDLVKALLIASAVGATALDAVVVVTFLRAVRARERAQMTMVFTIYRDAAGLIPPAIFAVLLSFFPVPIVFLATGMLALICSVLALKIPKGM
jgi:MFS family permease